MLCQRLNLALQIQSEEGHLVFNSNVYSLKKNGKESVVSLFSLQIPNKLTRYSYLSLITA